jgi:fluoride ion exporter CrcB/FEX
LIQNGEILTFLAYLLSSLVVGILSVYGGVLIFKSL